MANNSQIYISNETADEIKASAELQKRFDDVFSRKSRFYKQSYLTDDYIKNITIEDLEEFDKLMKEQVEKYRQNILSNEE